MFTGETHVKHFELQPHLVGELVELRPLVRDHWQGLFGVASDPKVWEQHPAKDRCQEDVFRKFFDEALASRGALVAIARETGAIIGSSRYFGYDPEKSEVEIGWSFLSRSYWGGRYNGEMKRLMLDHAFRFVDRVYFLVGTTNVRSQKAMAKIGGVLTDRRVPRSLNGVVYDHVEFEIASRPPCPRMRRGRAPCRRDPPGGIFELVDAGRIRGVEELSHATLVDSPQVGLGREEAG
jgi:N-acetyltransferase